MSSLVHSAAGAAPYPADQASPFLPDRQHDRVVYWIGPRLALWPVALPQCDVDPFDCLFSGFPLELGVSHSASPHRPPRGRIRPAVDQVAFRFEGVHGELPAPIANGKGGPALDIGGVKVALGFARQHRQAAGFLSRRGKGQPWRRDRGWLRTRSDQQRGGEQGEWGR